MTATTTPASVPAREPVANERAVLADASAPLEPPSVDSPAPPVESAPLQANTETAERAVEQPQQPLVPQQSSRAQESHVYPATTPEPPPTPAPAATQTVTVNVAQPVPSVTVVQLAPTASGPGLFIRALWFVFIGWWIGFLWAMTALVFEWTIIGLPLALVMFNRLPKVMTLKPDPVQQNSITVVQSGATTTVVTAPTGAAKQPLWLRAVYFVLVGWWLSLLWLVTAYVIGLTIIGLPAMFWMVNRIPAVTTLSSL